MSRQTPETEHGDRRRLRAWLTAGDPAADGRHPAPEESAALRRRMLAVAAAAGERRESARAPWWGAAGLWPAGAAAGLLLLAVGLGAYRWLGGPATPGERGPRTARQATPAEVTVPSPSTPSPGGESPEPAAAAAVPPPSAPAPVAPAAGAARRTPGSSGALPQPEERLARGEPMPQAAAPQAAAPQPAALQSVAETARPARQLRFTAQGGTRVIWVLDPELTLDITPRSAGETEAI